MDEFAFDMSNLVDVELWVAFEMYKAPVVVLTFADVLNMVTESAVEIAGRTDAGMRKYSSWIGVAHIVLELLECKMI